MRGRVGRGRLFGGGGAVWLGVGVLIFIAMIMRRHGKASNVIRAAYRTARKRFGGPQQPRPNETNFPFEEAGEFSIQEYPKAEAEVSSAEGEEGGWEEESQGVRSATAAGEGRSDVSGLPIVEYDSLTVSQVTQRLRELSLEEVEQLRAYEAENRNRRSVMQRFETRIRAARKNLEKRGRAEIEESSAE